MKPHCLPFSQIPHTTRLFSDYLSHTPQVQQFYPRSPNLAEWAREENPGSRYSDDRRQQVSAILERQNQVFQASAPTMANLERLRKGAAAVVTGQQVGLFGGPAFALYKALTAVKLAEQATTAGVEAVPVFWLATNDHDLAEVNHVWLSGADGVPELLTVSSHGREDATVGSIMLGPEIEEVVQRAASLLGESPATGYLLESYRPGETLGSAFARLMARLFADFGVILLDPCDPELGRIAQPIYQAAIERASELDEALLERGKALESAGYHQQVKVTPSSTLLFAIHDGARVPVHRRVNGGGEQFTIGEEKISREDLLQRIADRPYDFNPNVLLRPILQDYLLPTLAYTGGAAEIAYFAQVGVVYQALLGHVTPILPRYSATLIEPKENSFLEKYRLQLPDLFHGVDAVEEKIAGRILPQDLQTAFERAHSTLEKSIGDLNGALQKLDPTLVEAATGAATKMRYQLDRLQTRAATAQLQREETISRHAARLSHALFPNKALQEREIGGITYVARHGVELLQDLCSMIHTDCHDHQVVVLD